MASNVIYSALFVEIYVGRMEIRRNWLLAAAASRPWCNMQESSTFFRGVTLSALNSDFTGVHPGAGLGHSGQPIP